MLFGDRDRQHDLPFRLPALGDGGDSGAGAPKPSPLGKVAERSEVGRGLAAVRIRHRFSIEKPLSAPHPPPTGAPSPKGRALERILHRSRPHSIHKTDFWGQTGTSLHLYRLRVSFFHSMTLTISDSFCILYLGKFTKNTSNIIRIGDFICTWMITSAGWASSWRTPL